MNSDRVNQAFRCAPGEGQILPMVGRLKVSSVQSVVIDGLGRPLLAQPELASRYQLIHYHRRGYMGSTLGPEPLSMARQAGDAAALLRHLGVRAPHIAGHSYGGLIAPQLAELIRMHRPKMVFATTALPLRRTSSRATAASRDAHH